MTLSEQHDIMIQEHLLRRGIQNSEVLKAMREIPREEFISKYLRERAYGDHPLPISERQTISQPYIVAYMAEVLRLRARDQVLEIGTGSGYAAAVLSRIVANVYTVERLEKLAQEACQRLKKLGYSNIVILTGDGTLGWPEHAPYDAISVTAAAPEIPQPLLAQLAVGGRLVIPIGSSNNGQVLVLVKRLSENKYHHEHLCEVRFVPLIGTAGW